MSDTIMQPDSGGAKTAATVSALMTAGFAFLLALRKIENYDIWWHMKAGELTLQSGRILLEEAFSHTMAGAKWLPHEWLAEVFFYLVHQSGGLEGLGLVSASIAALAALAAWFRGRNLGAGIWLLTAVLTWALLSARFRFMVRPHIFFFLLAGVLLLLLENYDRTRGKALVLLTLPLMVLWVNLHGSFPLGYLFFGAWAAGALLFRRDLFPAGLFLLSLVAMLANPGGLETVISMKDLFISTTASKTVSNEEFMPPTLGGYPLFWGFFAFSTIIWLATAAKKRPSLLEAAVFLLTLALAIRSARYIAIFVFATAPYTAARLTLLTEEGSLLGRFAPVHPSSLRQTLACGCVLLLMAWGFTTAYTPGKTYRWGLGVNESFIPRGAVRFLKSTNLQDVRLYNNKRFGGYLTWALFPRFRVAMDGRDEIFAGLQAELDIYSFTRYRNMMKQYGFQIAVIDYAGKNEFEGYLVTDPVWRLIYWDDISLVYARQNLVPESFILPLEYTYISPLSLDYAYLAKPVKAGKVAAVISEIEKALAASPGSFKPYLYLGYVHQLTDRLKEATEAYEKALSANEELAILHYDIGATLGRLYLQAKKPKMATKAFERHFSANPKKGEPLYLYALALYQRQDYKKAEEYFNRYLDENPKHVKTLANIGFLLLDTGRPAKAEKTFRKAWESGFFKPALYGLALSYQERGNCAKAVPLWKTYLLSPDASKERKTKASRYLSQCEEKGGANSR